MKQYISSQIEIIAVRSASIVTTSPNDTLRYWYNDGESTINYMKYGNLEDAW